MSSRAAGSSSAKAASPEDALRQRFSEMADMAGLKLETFVMNPAFSWASKPAHNSSASMKATHDESGHVTSLSFSREAVADQPQEEKGTAFEIFHKSFAFEALTILAEADKFNPSEAQILKQCKIKWDNMSAMEKVPFYARATTL